MQQPFNSSPQKNYRQQSLTGFFNKKADNNNSRFNSLLNENTAQNVYQQKETFYNPRNDNNRAFNNLKGLSYENNNEERDKPIFKQQRQQYSQNAQSSLDYFTAPSNIPNNKSIVGQLMQQKENKGNQQYSYIEEDQDDVDEIMEIQDKGPFNRKISNYTSTMQRQSSIEDIDDDSIEIVQENNNLRANYYPQQKAGNNPLSQIIDNSAAAPQKNIFQPTILHNQIFRNKGYAQDNQLTNSQDAFNFQSNSQQKSSQEIIQDLELKKMRERSAFERQQKQKLGLQNYDDIKLNVNRFAIDPASLNQKRQMSLDELNSFRFKKDPSPTEKSSQLSQTQQISNILNNLNKTNIFANPPSHSMAEKNKEILDKFSNNNKRKPAAIFDIYNKGRGYGKNNFEDNEHNQNSQDEEENEGSQEEEDDSNSDENDMQKKQKLNDGRSRIRNQQLAQFNEKLDNRLAKQMKIKQKEEEKRQRVKQELIDQAKAERERKLQEESKMQRQKLVQYKKMQELKKQKMKQHQDLQQRNSIKEQLKAINFEENFVKSTSLQAKQFLLRSTKEITDGTASDVNGVGTNADGKVEDMVAYDKDLDFLFDETENEEEKKNYYSLLRFIFSQDYNKEDIVRVENKRIPNRSPFNSYIKLLKNKENVHGFFEFQVYKNGYESFETAQVNADVEAGELNSSEDDYYRLSTLRNHAVLISNESEPDLSMLSSNNFKKKSSFLFFGWVVPPENDKNGVLKIYADIEPNSFMKQFQQLDKKVPVKIFNFQKMTTFIREYLSIKNMRYNDLNRFIYNPSYIVEAKTPISNPQSMLPLFEELKTKFNVSQFQSIKEICLTSQGICMLQGPPGTGKTHTLLGLLSGLYYYIKKNPELTKPKIMICAPSNTAVDEIVSRIIEIGLLSPGGQKAHINVLRIGAIDYVPTENVKRACLEYQIERKMKDLGLGTDQNKKVEGDTLIDMQIEVAKINQEIEKSKKELYGSELASDLDYLFDKKRRIQQKISVLKLEKVARRDQIKNISDQLLGMADVVCCTLASSISEKLERFKNQIEVLIVDEAAQCTEPNNIIPLFYQPNKMVLIGDPKQLPATTFQPDSNVTKYNRSLFERIIDNEIKPYFLDQQYRMHPNIREFPSFQFYDNKLKDGPLVVNRTFPNYLQKLENNNVQFIDIVFSKEKMNNKSYENEVEGLASIHICNAIFDEIERLKKAQPDKQDNPSIGIITPYKQQTKLINELIRRQIPKTFHKFIQVNTVDSFQGQEKDIIIFSTVRVNSRDEWRENMIGFLQDERRMNVALTRARYCQIVLGHADTLNSNPIWGAFVDFMVKSNSYGKFKTKESLNDIGRMVLKGSLLEGSSAVYVKKDWGEEYKIMLQKTNQVNELKLTDFEPIQIDEEEIEHESPQGQEKAENEGQNDEIIINEEIQQDQQIQKIPQSDCPLIILSEKLNPEKKIPCSLEILEEPENFDQLKKGRTGVSLKEALEKHEEVMTMNSLRGGLGGLNALIDQSNDKNKNKSVSSNQVDEKPEIVIINTAENVQKEDDAQSRFLKKIFADKKASNDLNDGTGINNTEKNLDIYEIMEQQKRENRLRLKKEKMYQLQKKIDSATPSIAQAAANAANSIKQKLSNNENMAAASAAAAASQKQPSQPVYQNPALQLLQQVVSIPPISQTKSVFGGLSGLIGLGQQPSSSQSSNNFPSNTSVSIYDQINQQRQQHQKKADYNKPNQIQTSKPPNNTQIAKTSNGNQIAAKPQHYASQNNNQYQQPTSQSSSSQSFTSQNKYNTSNQANTKNQSSYQPNKNQSNSYNAQQNGNNSGNVNSSNPLSELLKNKQSSFRQPQLSSQQSQQQSESNKGFDGKYRSGQQQQQPKYIQESITVKSSAQQLLNNIYMKK